MAIRQARSAADLHQRGAVANNPPVAAIASRTLASLIFAAFILAAVLFLPRPELTEQRHGENDEYDRCRPAGKVHESRRKAIDESDGGDRTRGDQQERDAGS